jgi:hypothetical protein|tara:strand:- start:1 stop:474 length:474 start_codon:yes stop_codon:yes gene_type:complete
MKYLKYFSILLLLTLVVIQFIKPDKNNDGYQSVALFEKEIVPTKEIAMILKNNCYDCHSNQTNYPWYNNISPINYWLEEHIVDGKKHFNVSAWDAYSARKKDHKLEELVEYVEQGEMPLDSYTWLHGDLSNQDTQTLLQWAQLSRIKYQKQMLELAK